MAKDEVKTETPEERETRLKKERGQK